MRALWVVFAKEVLENARDRRSVTSALLFGPLFGPLLFTVLLGLAAQVETERAEAPLTVPVVGGERAPNLMNWLRQQGVGIEPPLADPEGAVRARRARLVVVIDERFAERLGQAVPAPVRLIHDRSRRDTLTEVRRVRGLLETYGRTVGLLRLQARGLDPGVVQALAVVEEDVSTAEGRAAALLVMMPFFVMMSLFIGGMYLAIDTTAGERERGTMEALLANPVPRGVLMLGKLLATVVFALLSLVLTLAMFALSLPFLPAGALGMEISLGFGKALLILVVAAPVALPAAALQTLIATFSRGFREAQTYVSLLVFIPMVPGLLLMLGPAPRAEWPLLIPVFAQNLLIDRILRGEAVSVLAVLASLCTTVLLGAGLAALAARLYRRESLLYSS